jgi:hypothetical protein
MSIITPSCGATMEQSLLTNGDVNSVLVSTATTCTNYASELYKVQVN